MEKTQNWKDSSNFHPAGEKADLLQSPFTAPIQDKAAVPDVSGTGAGEQTPFCAQRGEMP